jgi:hypothetical protein
MASAPTPSYDGCYQQCCGAGGDLPVGQAWLKDDVVVLAEIDHCYNDTVFYHVTLCDVVTVQGCWELLPGGRWATRDVSH